MNAQKTFLMMTFFSLGVWILCSCTDTPTAKVPHTEGIVNAPSSQAAPTITAETENQKTTPSGTMPSATVVMPETSATMFPGSPTFDVTPAALPEKQNCFAELSPGQYLLLWIYIDRQHGLLTAISYDGTSQQIPPTTMSNFGVISPDMQKAIMAKQITTAEDYVLQLINLQNNAVTDIPESGGCHDATWEPSSARFAAVCGAGNIKVFSLETNAWRSMNEWLLNNDAVESISWPQWSPDGNWIAYIDRPGIQNSETNTNLYLADASCLDDVSTCQSKTIGPFGKPQLRPPMAWSSDSRYLAMAEEDSIAILDPGAGEFRQIPMSSGSTYHALTFVWPPDNEMIAYECDVHGETICFVSSQTGQLLLRKEIENFELLDRWITIPYPAIPGDTYTITEAGHDLNLRSAPSLDSESLRKLQPGDGVTVLDGPVSADGYTWWKLKTSDGTEGWAVNIPEWYEPVKLGKK